MGGSGSKVTCANELMQKLFNDPMLGQQECTKEEVQIVNDLYNYYHLAEKRRVGEYGYTKTDGCGQYTRYENNRDYADKKEVLEQGLLTKLTEFFSQYNNEQIETYKNKLYRIEKKIIKDLRDFPQIPYFCKHNNKYTRDGSVYTENYEVWMFNIIEKQRKLRDIVKQAISNEAPAEKPNDANKNLLNNVQPNLKF